MAGKIMKWAGIVFGAAVALVGLLAVGFFVMLWFSFDGEPEPYQPRPDGYWQRAISKELLLDVQDSEVLYEMDTHGGFHGDGTATVVLKPDESLFGSIEGDSLWRALPLPESLTLGLFRDEAGEKLCRDIENGYYFYVDRSSEAEDIFDPSAASWLGSRNYSVAVYDADENILYFAESDS